MCLCVCVCVCACDITKNGDKQLPTLGPQVLTQSIRPSVLDTRVHQGANIDSDHCLVLCKVKLQWKRKTERGMKRINVEMLKEEEIREQCAM